MTVAVLEVFSIVSGLAFFAPFLCICSGNNVYGLIFTVWKFVIIALS